MASATMRQSSFQDLLLQLQQQHEFEIRSLRDQLHELSSQHAKDRGNFDGVVVSNTEAVEKLEDETTVDALTFALSEVLDAREAEQGTENGGTLSTRLSKRLSSKERAESKKQHMAGRFFLKKQWTEPPSHGSSKALQKRKASTDSLGVTGVKSAHLSNEVIQQEASFCSKYILVSPNSPKRLAWDLGGMILLLWDVIMIPMSAYTLPPSDFLIFMDWVTLIFWSIDVYWSCITGFSSKGVLVMEPVPILKNYVQTWFILDVLVVGPDWFFTILDLAGAASENGGAGGNVGKLLRTFRVVRTLRILRLAKLKRVIAIIKDRIESEYMFVVLNIFKLVLVLLIVNHAIAALWYTVGDLSRQMSLPSWVQFYNMPSVDFVLRYTTSLHWSLTQFTPGSMDVQPQNIVERVFAISVLTFGLIFFSWFISSMTASMSQIRTMQNETGQQFWLLRKFLRQRSVPADLSWRILRYVEYVHNQSNMVPRSRVLVLGNLSAQLRIELSSVIEFLPIFSHPLLDYARSSSDQVLTLLITKCLSQWTLAAADMLFGTADDATHVYHVVSGLFRYSLNMYPSTPASNGNGHDTVITLQKSSSFELGSDKNGDGSLDEERDRSTIRPGDWLSEPGLWAPWSHLADAQAISEAQLVLLDVNVFAESMRADNFVWYLMSQYCSHYLAWLNSMDAHELTDVSTPPRHLPLVQNFVDMSLQAQEDAWAFVTGGISSNSLNTTTSSMASTI